MTEGYRGKSTKGVEKNQNNRYTEREKQSTIWVNGQQQTHAARKYNRACIR
jgi:hypothetical protein